MNLLPKYKYTNCKLMIQTEGEELTSNGIANEEGFISDDILTKIV